MLALDCFWKYRCNQRGCCCRGWRISFREPDTHRLIKAARGTDLEAVASEALETQGRIQDMDLIPPSSSHPRFSGEFARVRYDEKGVCPFLDDQGGCRVHGELGEDVLPELCANYPVVGLSTPGGVECYFETACPEVLRCLVEESGELAVTEAPASFERRVYAFEYDEPIQYVRLTAEDVVEFDDYARFRRDAIASLGHEADRPLAAFARLLWFVTEWAARGHAMRTFDRYELDEGAYVTALAHLATCFRSAAVTWTVLEGRLGLARQFLSYLPWETGDRLDRLSEKEPPDAHRAAGSLSRFGPASLTVIARFLAARVFATPLQNEDSLLGGTLSLAETLGTGLYVAGAMAADDSADPGPEIMGAALGLADFLFRARKESSPAFDASLRLTEVALAEPAGTLGDLAPALAGLMSPQCVTDRFSGRAVEVEACDTVLKERLRVALESGYAPAKAARTPPENLFLEDPWTLQEDSGVKAVTLAQGRWFARLSLSGRDVPLAWLVRGARLSETEAALVALLLRVQTETGWARAVAHAGLEYRSADPSLGTLQALFGSVVHGALDPGGRLSRLCILREGGKAPVEAESRFALDPHVVAFLLGGNGALPEALAKAQPEPDGSVKTLPLPPFLVEGFHDFQEGVPDGTDCVLLLGARGYDPVALVRQATGREPLALWLQGSEGFSSNDGHLARQAVREAILGDRPLVLILEGAAREEACLGDVVAEAASLLAEPVVVVSAARPPGLYNRAVVAEWTVPAPTPDYLAALAARGVPRELVLSDPEGIRQAVAGASITPACLVAAVSAAGTASLLREEGPGPRRFLPGHLVKSMRSQMRTRLGEFADLVTVGQGLEDLVLPPEPKSRLEEMVTSWRHRERVLEEWGFGARVSHSRGMTCLFYGPPGTGKTMAAGIVSRELGLEVFRVDLSRVVDKYIGETEKHLSRVFEEAERGQVMLLFDEADSLFGKRTSGGTSVDRYANMEVNYLLQRMERYEGVVVLTTNNERLLDEAFKRRLRYRVHFPLPTSKERERIWRGLLPPEAQVSGDLDWGQLSRQYEMSGGHIRNAMLRAAYLSADRDTGLTMKSLKQAADIEYRELGRLVREEEEAQENR